MKSMVKGEFPNNRLLKVIFSFTLIYLAFLFVTGILMEAGSAGFTYDSVLEHYLGNEAKFKNPVSYRGLLEAAHFHLFATAIVLLFLNHLVAFTSISQCLKLVLILLSFIFGFLDAASPWLIRFVSPTFAYLKIGSFFIFNAAFFTLLVISFSALKVYDRK